MDNFLKIENKRRDIWKYYTFSIIVPLLISISISIQLYIIEYVSGQYYMLPAVIFNFLILLYIGYISEHKIIDKLNSHENNSYYIFPNKAKKILIFAGVLELISLYISAGLAGYFLNLGGSFIIFIGILLVSFVSFQRVWFKSIWMST